MTLLYPSNKHRAVKGLKPSRNIQDIVEISRCKKIKHACLVIYSLVLNGNFLRL